MISEKVKEKLDIIDSTLKRYEETIYFDVTNEKIENYCKWNSENCNGLSLENNIYESNEIYWENENLKQYLFLGEDSISWYGIAIESGEYYILDKPSGSVMNKCVTFEELFLIALNSVL